MNREQAVRIQKHILDADVALDRARIAIADLGKEERLTLDGLLQEAVETLHLDLLEQIYDQYPDLEPPLLDEEIPTISSSLQRKEVSLPASISEADLDQIIFAAMTSRLQKTAMVIARAVNRCEELGVPIDAEIFGARIGALAEADRIEGAGDLRKWRYSEVRLKD
jgi:phosphotransacetylase